MKAPLLTKLVLMMLVVLFAAVPAVRADDAAIKRQLLGYWQSPRHQYLYKSDGVRYMVPRPENTTTNRWDVRNGLYYEDGEPYKIITLTRTVFKYQAVHGNPTVFPLTRITKAEAEKH